MANTRHAATIGSKLLLICCFALSACSRIVDSPNVPTVSLANRAPNVLAFPKITAVTRILAKKTQKVVISGRGFGVMKPYNGNSPYIRMRDNTANWNAGHEDAKEYDQVTLRVQSWSGNKIVITGFTGQYGANDWFLSRGESLTISVWSARSAQGPAKLNATVF